MRKTALGRAVCSLAGEFYGFLCGRYRAIGKRETERVFDEWGDALSKKGQEEELQYPENCGLAGESTGMLPDYEDNTETYNDLWGER